MVKFIQLSAIVAFLATTAVMATPTPAERDLAPRSYTSNGVSCYSKCPGTANGGGFTYDGTSGAGGQCTYTDNSNAQNPTGSCTYDPSGKNPTPGGAFTQPSQCPPEADFSSCGGQTAGQGEFKRDSLRPKRRLTKGEKAIKARQFDPKAAKNKAKKRKFSAPV